ncbi:hypothetical protein [Clostridium sp. YIM B02506]|uniref:hypothetical protein n=1 Tax=Clostridium sp. YIM B02506 TaxID=2910680 RepID=UPI001EED7EF6|nr:hypothetical protein [Clostridium sp. YIM B02506]
MKNARLICVFIITSCLLFVSCKNTQVENNKPENEITFKNYEGINKVSVIYDRNGKISLISDIYKNEVLSKNEDGYVLSYRKETNSYLKTSEISEEKKLVLGINNKEYTLKDFTDLFSAKQSPKGNKVLYKKYNEAEEVEFSIFDSSNEKDIPLEINTLISGENYFWKDNNTIIYYGINDKENKNGIYSYNISSDEETLLYELKQGIIEYMQLTDEYIYFMLNSLNGKKEVNRFSIKDKSLVKITDKFKYISSVAEEAGSIYILGEEESSGISIYSIIDGKLKRVIYDFPRQIDPDRGMIKDKDGNILFIGYENIKEDEDVYVYSTVDKGTKIISKKVGKYFFIETN